MIGEGFRCLYFMALFELNPVGIHGIKTTEYTKVDKQDMVSDETTITEVTCNMSLAR